MNRGEIETQRNQMRTVFFFSSADLFGPLNATFIIPVQRWKENKNRTGTSFPPPHPPPPLFSTTGCLKVERLKFFTVYDRAIYPRKTFTSVPIDTNVHGFHELLDRVSFVRFLSFSKFAELLYVVQHLPIDSRLVFVRMFVRTVSIIYRIPIRNK